MGTADRLRSLVVPLIDDRGLELYDIDQSGGTLQILVSRPGGLDVGVLTELTRAISRTLDEHDPIPGKYLLEVSSPGLERPLRRPGHYRDAVGSEVTVKTNPGTEGDRRVRGVLTEADDEAITITSSDGGERRVAYREIERARTVFEWAANPKPGSRPRRQSDHEKASDAMSAALAPERSDVEERET